MLPNIDDFTMYRLTSFNAKFGSYTTKTIYFSATKIKDKRYKDEGTDKDAQID